MKIKLIPSVRNHPRLIASVSGDKLTLNGAVFDFTPLPSGALLPVDSLPDVFADDVVRENGEISVSIILPVKASDPEGVRFPDAYLNPVSVKSGPVPMPQGYEGGAL